MPNSNVVNLYPVPNGTIGDRVLTVADAAVTLLTSASLSGNTSTSFDELTRYIVLDVQDADVRVTYDGVAPTATVGHRLFAGRSYTWAKETAEKAKFIRVGNTSGKVHASEFTQ
tara:strand:- start:1343 stop:1684 length:342 start_codon:yes stop_codon:yes gene_type:complete